MMEYDVGKEVHVILLHSMTSSWSPDSKWSCRMLAMKRDKSKMIISFIVLIFSIWLYMTSQDPLLAVWNSLNTIFALFSFYISFPLHDTRKRFHCQCWQSRLPMQQWNPVLALITKMHYRAFLVGDCKKLFSKHVSENWVYLGFCVISRCIKSNTCQKRPEVVSYLFGVGL